MLSDVIVVLVALPATPGGSVNARLVGTLVQDTDDARTRLNLELDLENCSAPVPALIDLMTDIRLHRLLVA